MNLVRRLASAYGLAVISAAAFVVLAWLIGQDRISRFDMRVIETVQGWESPGLTRLMESLTWFGKTVPMIGLTLLAMLILGVALRHRGELILLAAAVGGAALLNLILKHAFRRERPDFHRLIEETGYSFPSGHSMGIFALAGILAYLLWRHIRSAAGRTALVLVLALLYAAIALSRIYLGVHYPSDVIAGLFASLTWLSLAIGAFRRRRRQDRAA